LVFVSQWFVFFWFTVESFNSVKTQLEAELQSLKQQLVRVGLYHSTPLHSSPFVHTSQRVLCSVLC
jgi:hypothetical protein